MKQPLLAALLALAGASVSAQMSPVGLWKTIDDDSGKEKSLVRITEKDGVFVGHIERLLDPSTDPKAVCEKCTDDRKDQPVVGMNILRGVRQSASDPTLYEGGTIVDPNNGKVYRNRLKPVNGGQQLEMRGYLGPFYRTQVWQRVQ